MIVNEQAKELQPLIDEVYKNLKDSLQNIDGAFVEHVKYTVSAHYRLVEEERVDEFKKIVADTIAKHSQLRVTTGKKVLEVRPNIDWHKGEAVCWILDRLSYDRTKHKVVYIGDDTTDEDAFETIGDRGISVLVAQSPRETKARYIVKSTQDVFKILTHLTERAQQ